MFLHDLLTMICTCMKNPEYLHVEIFVNIYLCIRDLVILYNELLHKYKFGQAHCVELTMRSPTKFSLQFLGISKVFYEL
jgi:hypothetical protein